VQRSAALAPEVEEGILPVPKFIDIDGKRFAWRDLAQRRREQLAAEAKVQQPVLFELKEDRRPASQRSAAGRYREPSLFSLIEPDR
jgi:hypothetical protein